MSAPIITDYGKKALGDLLKESRQRLGLSIDKLLALIEDRTTHSLSKSTISELERGNVVPNWDTLSILADAGYIKHSQNTKPLTTTELFEIACSQTSGFCSVNYGSERLKTLQLADQKGSKRYRSDQIALTDP